MSGHDTRGVAWSGTVIEAIGALPLGSSPAPRDVLVPVRRQPKNVDRLGLEESQVSLLSPDPLGRLVLYDVDEMLSALAASLPSAALAMAGKVLDGFLKFEGQSTGWWPAALDTSPLGPVLQNSVVISHGRTALGNATWERLEHSFLYLRNTGAHQKYVEIALSTAESEVELTLNVLNRWSHGA